MATKKNFSLIVKMLVAIMTLGMTMVSCDPADKDLEVTMMKHNDGPTPVVNHDWHRQRVDVPVENEDEYVIHLVDSSTMEKHTLTGQAVLSCEKYDYAIFEEHKNLDVAYSNKNKVMGETMLTPTDTGYIAVTNIVFPLEDGNTVTVSDTAIWVNGVPHDVLKDVVLTSLNNVAPAQPRAAYYEKERLHTEVVALLTYVSEGLSLEEKTEVTLRDLVTRRLMEEDDIKEAHSKDRDRRIIDNTTEKCIFTEVFTMKSGEKNEVPRNYVLYREFKGIDPYNLTVDNFTYNFQQSYGVTPGTEYPVKSSEENWTVTEVEDRYNAYIAGPIGVTTQYTLKHQGCVYEDKWGVREAFEILPVEVSEAGTEVSGATSDRDGYDKGILNNSINTLYGGYAQALSEYVNLYKERNDVIDEGWETESETHTFTNTTQTCTINYFEKYRNGEIVRTPFKHTFGRDLVCTSDFVSIEQNSSAQTDGARMSSTSESKKDGEWTWVEERGTISANVQLAGSKKQDVWTYKEANSIKVTYKGKTHSFRVGTYELQNSASVGSGVEKGDYTEYPYSDVLAYKFSTADVKQSTAPGTIKVEIESNPFFPPEFGTLLSATETVAPSADRKTYVYTWSLHFTNGTLPVVVPRGSLSPDWNFGYFSTDTNPQFNGGYFVKSSQTWINTIANDGKDWMEWLDNANSNKGNMAYSTGTAWGWDEGHQVSGHPSVFTSRHTLTVTNGELKAYDTYLGKPMTDDHVNRHGGWK